MKHIHVTDITELEEMLMHTVISNCIFRNLDFSAVGELPLSRSFHDCIFVGCHMSDRLKEHVEENNIILPRLRVPYRVPSHLYSSADLYDAYRTGDPSSYARCYDSRVYAHYLNKGKQVTPDTDLKDSFGRVLHDYAISNLLHEFLSEYGELSVIGVMGGHGMLRTDPAYSAVVRVSKMLTEEGYLMVSGGGPGAMEATHLGAWMAGRSGEEVDKALEILSGAPSFKDELWLDSAFKVMDLFPVGKYRSLGIPTWLYGHEPATPFATHIAKYFDNSIREDSILTIAKGGIIYTPGSAGTIQEIFQDATQNHYESFGFASPMVFMGKEFWTGKLPVYNLLESLMEKGLYRNLILHIVDNADEAVEAIKSFSCVRGH